MALQTLSKPRTSYDVRDIGVREFTFVGESHPDEAYADLLLSLMQTKQFSTVYLEALQPGLVKEDYKEKLRERGVVLERPEQGLFAWPEDGKLVYDYNPQKYDRIIDNALAKGIRVHGIDVVPKSRLPKLIDEWTDYILSTKDSGPCLILTGASHAWYRHPPSQRAHTEDAKFFGRLARSPEELYVGSVSHRLIRRGVLRSDIIVIAHPPSLESIDGVREGLFGIGAPIPLGAKSKIQEWVSIETDRKIRELMEIGLVPGPNNDFWRGNYERVYEEVSRTLPYSDEKSYVNWLKRQWVIGDPILDVFFFPLNDSHKPEPR